MIVVRPGSFRSAGNYLLLGFLDVHLTELIRRIQPPAGGQMISKGHQAVQQFLVR